MSADVRDNAGHKPAPDNAIVDFPGPPECCLRGGCHHAKASCRKWLIAHARGQIWTLGLLAQDDLIHRNLPVDASSVALEIARRVNAARPRSRYIPSDMTEAELDLVIRRVAADVVAAQESEP
jgi:hypothetical protein